MTCFNVQDSHADPNEPSECITDSYGNCIDESFEFVCANLCEDFDVHLGGVCIISIAGLNFICPAPAQTTHPPDDLICQRDPPSCSGNQNN